MNHQTCCKGCGRRHPKCHADCPDKAAQDAAREELKKKKAEKVPVMAYSREKKARVQQKRRRHQRP